MSETVFGIIFVCIIGLPIPPMVWGLWPLMTSRDSSAYRRFVLADMYALVLQIAVAGAILSDNFRKDDRLIALMICTALVLAVIWRFMVAALDDHKVGGNRERMIVLTVAPLQILFGPVVFWMGVVLIDKANIYGTLGVAVLIAGLLIPFFARLIYQWALRTKKPADAPPAVSGS